MSSITLNRFYWLEDLDAEVSELANRFHLKYIITDVGELFPDVRFIGDIINVKRLCIEYMGGDKEMAKSILYPEIKYGGN
jgi:hypothetical protein